MAKVIADEFHNASATLLELLDFESVALKFYENLLPFSSCTERVSLPKYIVNTSTELHKLLITDFGQYFPTIKRLLVDGKGNTEHSFWRIQDACFRFSNIQQAVYEKGCKILDDAIREDLSEEMSTVVSDLVVFIAIQFGLYTADQSEVYRSVEEYCDANGVTVDVLYGTLLSDLESVEGSWYAFEPISPCYQDVMRLDPTFLDECEENTYPLTDDVAMKIINGDMTLNAARKLMYSSGSKSELVTGNDGEEGFKSFSPARLIESMKLD